MTNFRVDDVSVQVTVPPDLTPCQSGIWNDKIPIGTSQLAHDATHSYTGSYFDNQTLYFTWGSLNQGGARASGYTVHFEVTGTGGGSWDWPGQTTDAMYWIFPDNDQGVGPLSAGNHTFKLWLDYYGNVDEGANEGNNYYERTITVQSSTESITTPGTITGEASPIQNVWYSYTVGTATSSLGHTVEYSFDWGDGYSSSFSTMTSASHAWSSTGQRSISVTARCQTHPSVSNNNSPGKSVTVTLSGPAPIASFYGDLRPVTGKLATYNGSISTGTGLSYAWTTSAGHASSASAPSFAFNSPGQYTVSLTVTDSQGRNNSASATIYVQAANNGSAPGQPVGADPVVLSAGNYVQEHVDLRLPGKGFPFEFKRFYNSKFGDQTGLPLGFGWTHAYNERISVVGTNALVVRGDGSTWSLFEAGGGYASEPGVFDSLVHNGNGTWSLTDKNQMVKQFDSTGHLASITDKNGNALNLSYTGGVLRQIQDTAGRSILLNMNAFGCISDITDPIGRTIVFQYDGQTNLMAVVDANNHTNTYTYNTNHQLTDAFDAKGNCYVHNEYDTNSFVVRRQHDVFSNWTFFDYDFTNRVTYQTNVLRKLSIHVFDEHLLATNIVDEAGSRQAFAYDTNGNRILARDKRGNSTGYGYDARGNVTNKTDALNNTTTIEYNASNNPTKRTDALTQTTCFAYNANGNLTQTTNALAQVSLVDYNASGLPLVLTDANGHKTTNTFDAQGNLTQVQDALGNITTFGYDGAGRKVAQTNANKQVTRYFYDNNDNLLRVVDPLNQTTTHIYDANNNRIATIDARGASTTNTLDNKDRVISVRDAMNDVTSYEYDALDRKTKFTDARSGVTQFGYDDLGNLLASTNALSQVTRYTYDANGNQTSIINPLGQTTTSIFDTLNRLVMTIDPLNHTSRTVYDALGRRIQAIDPLNRTNQFTYDLAGRLTQVTDANGGTTQFSYDNVGNRLVTTDPNNHSTTNTFDALNRLVQIGEAGGGVYQFAYDRVGNRTNQIDPKFQSIAYSYDANNRRAGITYPSGAPVTFGYDVNGNRTNMTDSLGATAYQYDALNRLVSVTDAFGKTVSYGYDANGNRVSLTYPGGKVVIYGYDSLNRLISVTDWLNGVTTYAYDSVGSLVHTTNPNTSTVDYGHDTANRLTGLTNTAPNGTPISSYGYTLDAIGNHIQVNQIEPLDTTPVTGLFSYTYDADNRLTSAEGQPHSHDSNGNMTALNATNILSYDFEDRLTQTVFGVTNQYQYDGTGNRKVGVRSGVLTRYVLDLNSSLSQILAETDGAGNVTAYYVYGLGLIFQIKPGGTARYYHYDSRGSTIAMTDTKGAIVSAYAYDPFGRIRDMLEISENRFRYLGRHGITDENNGFSCVRARYYNARRGRFITKDPLTGKDGDPQSLNRYIYALNNPVRLIDISGLSAREASHTTVVFATSDSSRLHNILISPSTGGLATQTPKSTLHSVPETLDQVCLVGDAPELGDGSIISAWTSDDLKQEQQRQIETRTMQIMGINPASPGAYGQYLNRIFDVDTGAATKQAENEILGSNDTGWSSSQKWAYGTLIGFKFIDAWDFTTQTDPIHVTSPLPQGRLP